MNASSLLVTHHCVGLSRQALQQLRASLERGTGVQSAAFLQEAGFAGGASVYAAFEEWVRARYDVEPAGLDIQFLGDALGGFFREFGWGSLTPDQLVQGVMSLESSDWAEASEDGGAQYPSCHFSCGMLADFLGRLSSGLVGVMEVECRSRGDARCRFLAGSPETMHEIYSRMEQGQSYQRALGLDA